MCTMEKKLLSAREVTVFESTLQTKFLINILLILLIEVQKILNKLKI